MVQSNSIGATFVEVFHVFNLNIPPVAVGVVVADLRPSFSFGGTKRLAAVVEKIVPIMAGVYIVGSVILIANEFHPDSGDFQNDFCRRF